MILTPSELDILETIIHEALAYEPPSLARLCRIRDIDRPWTALVRLIRAGFVEFTDCGRCIPLKTPEGAAVELPMTFRNALMRGPAALPMMPPLERVGGRLRLGSPSTGAFAEAARLTRQASRASAAG